MPSRHVQLHLVDLGLIKLIEIGIGTDFQKGHNFGKSDLALDGLGVESEAVRVLSEGVGTWNEVS